MYNIHIYITIYTLGFGQQLSSIHAAWGFTRHFCHRLHGSCQLPGVCQRWQKGKATLLCARGIIFVMSLGLNKYHKHSFILFNTLCVGRAKLSPACSSFLSVFWLRSFTFCSCHFIARALRAK